MNDNLKKGRIPWRRLILFGAAALALILGYLLAAQWTSDRSNSFLAVGTIVVWAGGIFLALKGWSYETDKVIITGSKRPVGEVNSLNIYARKDNAGKVTPDRVVFENVKHPLGQPSRCISDGRSYFVHILDLATGKLVPFLLPDSQFFDPTEFGNVLEMPAHRRLFQRKVSLMQKVAPYVMLIALIVSLFILVILVPK